MSQQPTCGQGLAEHAALPEKFADVIGAVAENLEIHLGALNPSDKRSRPEFDAYVALTTEHREIESRLRALALQMEGYRDLPMAEHDMAVMTSPSLATRPTWFPTAWIHEIRRAPELSATSSIVRI